MRNVFRWTYFGSMAPANLAAAQLDRAVCPGFRREKLTAVKHNHCKQLQNDNDDTLLLTRRQSATSLEMSFNNRELDMHDNFSSCGTLLEMDDDEINAVSGGLIFVAPVVVKIGAWALGAAAGSALVLGVIHTISK